MEDGVRGKDRSAPMQKEVPIPPKSGDDQEGLSQEQRAVCREAAVGIVFPSHSLFGSFNEAVASGLLHANPMERVDLEAAPLEAAQPPAKPATCWAPTSAAMKQARAVFDERIAARKRERPGPGKPYPFPVLQKGKTSLQCQAQVNASVEAGFKASAAKAEALRATSQVNFNKFRTTPMFELEGENRRPENSEISPATGEIVTGIYVQKAPPMTSSRSIRAHYKWDDLIELALDHACSDRGRGRTKTGVRAWFTFCEDIMGTPANRPMDPLTTPLWEKLEDEWLAMRFVCALVQERGISPQSAYVYFSCVQGWHAREHGVKLAGGLKLERLPQMLKGLRRIVGDRPKAVRRGVAPLMLKRAMDLCLDPSKPRDANIRAALATALQGLLRSAEYTADAPHRGFDVMKTLMRTDVTLATESMTIMMWPCKNMHHLGGKTCPLVIGAGGDMVDAVWEVRNMLSVDPVPHSLASSTPLFREPATNLPFAYGTMNSIIKGLMAAVGEHPTEFATHSLRIGGATALFAAGANETVIRTMGRWSSDLYRLYVHACHEQCCLWSAKAGSTEVSPLSGTFDEVDDY
jgi:hypothetical protein